jgi:hypothetical protein
MVFISSFVFSEEKLLKEHFSLGGEIVGESLLSGLVSTFNLSFIDEEGVDLNRINHICLLSMNDGNEFEINLYFDLNRHQRLSAYTVSEGRDLTPPKCISVESIETTVYALIGLNRDDVKFLLGEQDSYSTDKMWIYEHSWPTYTLDPIYGYSSVVESENLEYQYFEVGTLNSVMLGLEFDSFDKVALVRMSRSDEIIYSVKEVGTKLDVK